jgi:hypothetical protein
MTPEPVLLFELRVDARLEAALPLASGQRRIAVIDGGRYAGPRLKGSVAAGGVDWLMARPDGVREIDARIVLRQDDGEAIAMRYLGYRTAEPEILARELAGEAVDPTAFAYRTAHLFEASGACAWLNDVVGVGVGARGPEGLVYRVYQLG